MNSSEYVPRRARFFDALGEATAILPGARVLYRNADAEHPFRQTSDLLYLTGYPEPDAVAVFRGVERDLTLFVRPRDRAAETWTGRRHGVEGAAAFGADAAYPIAELDARLPELLAGTARLAYRVGVDEAFDRVVFAAVRAARERARRGGVFPNAYVDPGPAIAELRLRKSAAEVATMRAAAAITAAGFAEGMAATRPGLPEYALQATIEACYRRRGAQGTAYPSIVAGGENATILHYHANRDALAGDALVLVDSGCELDGYASDVTRTWPVDGSFSGPQRALYEIVLDAQTAAIETLVAGAPFDRFHDEATRVLVDGLRELGVLHGDRDGLIERRAYAPYYMHRTGHWLGLDVHDVGATVVDGRPRALEPGMVVTVEPGLYVPADAEVDPRFRGVGVRIEDDVLITGGDPENLTAAIPKRIDALEAAIGGLS